MRLSHHKFALSAVCCLLGAATALGQSVSLTAAASSAVLPDGQTVPMWGLSCAPTLPSLPPLPILTASCAAANPNAAGAWSPVIITVAATLLTGPASLTINLTNNLPVPTSLTIVGQVGGGLGDTTKEMAVPSPTHAQQGTTWPIANGGSTYQPPPQGTRVQSFAQELPAGSGPTALTWPNLRPGTYLIESGTHPSIQGPMGLYGILVVTQPAVAAVPGMAYPNVNYNADVPLIMSEIDPVQNSAVAKAVATPGFSETMVWSGQPGGCGYPGSTTYGQCYPPAVNYSPLYYMVNGVSLDRSNLGSSVFSTTPAIGVTGQVLVRMVNAGLRMHVPSIVGSTAGSAVPVAPVLGTVLPAASGFSLIAEDGNVLPGTPRVQSEVFMAAGKTYDVMINVPSIPLPTLTNPVPTLPTALPIFDRQLSLSANNQRDGGMQAYISVNGAAAPSNAQTGAKANADSYIVIANTPLAVSDPAKGVIANDVGVYGVQMSPTAPAPAHGTVSLSPDGTFTYTPDTSWTSTTTDSFVYQANGKASLTAIVSLGACTGSCLGGAPTPGNASYTSNVASLYHVGPPGVLMYATDPQGHPMTASTAMAVGGGSVILNPDGSFTASPTTAASGTPATVTFQYKVANSQGTSSTNLGTATVTFLPGSGLKVNVLDAPVGTVGTIGKAITDYRWIIEEDRTFQVDPSKETISTTNPVQSLGTNFHTSYMPVIATGCVGTLACESGQTMGGAPVVCDIGDGVCRTTASQQTPVDPSQVHLDPNRHYYISILPGDAGNSFTYGGGAPQPVNPTDPNSPSRQFDITKDCGAYTGPSGNWEPGKGQCGHGMGGAQIPPAAIAAKSVNVLLQETPFQPAKISVFVYEDDFPLNGENDAGGGVDILAPNEPGLGGFEVRLWDDAGGTGGATGQLTYDMFNMPLSNSLAGTIDPVTTLNACPITAAPDGIVGRIVTCPKFESDGKTLSPLAGQAIIANMMPGRYGVQANPGADRTGKGEEWLQTNTLDGQKAHDSFIKQGGPAYFQEFGPAGFHVSIGFAQPALINARLAGVCNGSDINVTGTNCHNKVTGKITMMRQSHPPDQRLYSSGTNDALSFTQCYVSLGDPDGEDFAFAKCDANGNFELDNIPDGDWRITAFDQWNDQIVDGLSTPVRLTNGTGYNFTNLAVQQWQTNVSTTTFFDANGDGIRQPGEQGLALVPTNVRFRDGSFSNFNNTDLNGYAAFNEEFPLFNWYTIEADTTRYKSTGVHVVYDGGGPAATSGIAANLAGTAESSSLPTNLRFPGSVYCNTADCTDIPKGIKAGPGGSTTGIVSTGRIDPPWVTSEGWQGFIGQYEFLEFGKTPFVTGENGGIHGEVVYASTRPFDDPSLLTHLSWTPNVPGVTVNLYQESTAADGTTSLKMVDTTKTSSWDDWAQGFRSDGVPNMNCPGQASSSGGDPFYFTLQNTPFFLDQYNATYNNGTQHTLPNNSQFKCYDGLHNFNQVQPAPYDGAYKFPSVTSRNPSTGAEAGTNCTVCKANPTGDGTQMLPAGKYVVEVVVPPGYELVKEEDKNILIGDNYIAPVTQEFGGLGSIFILPDQAEVTSLYNANNAQNSTNTLGRTTYPTSDVAGSTDTAWPCVGASRVVPDFISLFPGSAEVAPFAGATRNLCDRKEVTLGDQTSALAKFWIFSSTHVAAHFTGFILDDLSSEFDPFSPQFGEKFAVPNLPVSIKDFAGNEVERVYADQWGTYNGLNYSTWEVNPPNPTGYAPTMMVACMNDPGTGATPDQYFNPSYSQFCYEIPYMPGQTQYMDTPVVPTAAFAEGYNPPDCNYPSGTPAIGSVIGSDAAGAVGGSSGKGPWVSGTGTGHTLTITALGDRPVPNPAYTGPQATQAPFNQKFVTRHYGFGTQCTAIGAGCTAVSSVTIGGISAPIGTWSDTSIAVTVPANVPSCAANGTTPLQRNGTGNMKYAAQCGEVVITSGTGQKSIDSITVTVGGKPPSVVSGENSTNSAIQTAIDGATPGDLILVSPGVYQEMVLMWKPVRLQGSGAGGTIINANTHPSGKLDPWRRQVNCLFGLALNGSLLSAGNAYDPTGTYTCSPLMRGAVDPLPLEGIVGWDTTLNGNLAQLLQEPSLMGAYEGAGITVLAKGENMSIGLASTGAAGTEGDFPTGSRVLTNSVADCNKFQSNFWCNPSRIDGFSITNSSQGGGGIFAHAWNHNLEVSNNRIYGNAGTLSGGINIGQGETPDPTFNALNVEMPFNFETNVLVHNNSVTANTSYGDELFSSSPSAAGGVTFCTGADYYHFNYNWVCGNLSTGDGGGLVHEGFSYNGDISHNWILFNQSNNITLPTNGGGIAVLGAAPDGTTPAGTECGNTAADADCAPGLSDGTGPNLVIDSNVIMGNTAESGSGGGIRLQTVNGTDVTRTPLLPGLWNSVTVTNNIVSNNVAGWDGGGISLQDALNVKIINNTVASNDTTASAGVLFNTIGAPGASTPPPGCDPSTNPTCAGKQVLTSTPQAAGLVTMQNTANLATQMPKNVICPAGNFSGGILKALNGTCTTFSYPLLANNLFWQNRIFNIQVGGLGTGNLNQQNLVTLLPQLSQTSTGQCAAGPGYWDIGVRGDTGPHDHSSTVTLNPTYSILSDTTGYGISNSSTNPNVASQYCNGSRVPPELGGTANPFGFQVPPGISDATVPNPVFNLTPAATVDEGNNWINLTYGPLSLGNPTLASATLPTASGTANGNYSLTSTSTSAIGVIKNTGLSAINYGEAPSVDILGTPRKTNGAVDIGAVEYVPPAYAIASITPTSLAFGNVVTGTTSASQTLTLSNTGGASLTGIALVFSSPTYSRPAGTAGGTCTATLAAGTTCTINVVFTPTTAVAVNATLAVNGSVTVTGSPVALSGTGVAPLPVVSITPTALAFGNVVNGSTSPSKTLTLSNTGNATFTGIALTFSSPRYSRPAGTAGGTCGTTLAAAATCTINVVFAPTASGAVNATLGVTGTNAAVTGSPVGLSGTGVLPGTASITPNPLTITLAAGGNPRGGTGTVTLTNTSTNAAPVTVTSVAVSSGAGSNILTWFFNAIAGQDTCTGTVLAPGATCTVGVRFTNVTAASGANRAGTIVFTDNATGNSQTGVLTGHAN
ncbi:hypothetical protein HDF16_003442 [Granulicella aggregans]|uniref:RapA2 cadherin-like domain-containing protein n=1 Tax=Granulicella aggregans TaxID=474949 RepID=A0A7W8E468_9BACT|nr:choice-of-anchor D domain-containing protein [Granulicella aggregans]MBB5058728.1 hypothetical protein [Granulicella aggregans]